MIRIISALTMIGIVAGSGVAEAQDKAAKSKKQELAAGFVPTPRDESKQYGPAEGKTIKLFIMSGQSNMVGQGISNELPEPWKRGDDERVLMFEAGAWQPLRPHRKMFGPEISFGHAMAKAWPGETIGIVKQGIGGTGIMAWHPQWTKEKAAMTNDAKKGNLWKALTDKVAAARKSAPCEVAGFIWMQGGKDMKSVETGKLYLENLEALVNGLRKETGVAKLPVALGLYSSDRSPDDYTNIDVEALSQKLGGRGGALYVLKAQWDAQKTLAPLRAVPLKNLERHPADVHYNTNGQLDLGNLFADDLVDLIGDKAATKRLKKGRKHYSKVVDSE